MVAEVLQRPTLVLNRNWQPVNVASVARALVLVWNESAKVVDPSDYQTYEWEDWASMTPVDDQPFIQAVSQRICVPEVITLTRFSKLPSATVPFSRRNLFKRDRYTCQYCNKRPRQDELTIDHVVPRSHGGGSTWENCVLACIDCNHRKADRTPKQANLKLKKDPARPKWNPVYSRYETRYESWAKFISDAYWNAELEE
jgi:5-methylcytosine-specific restriction endonuclease McrA